MQGSSLVRIQLVYVAGKLYLGRGDSTINLGRPAGAGPFFSWPPLLAGHEVNSVEQSFLPVSSAELV